jgi:hypothetical protein
VYRKGRGLGGGRSRPRVRLTVTIRPARTSSGHTFGKRVARTLRAPSGSPASSKSIACRTLTATPSPGLPWSSESAPCVHSGAPSCPDQGERSSVLARWCSSAQEPCVAFEAECRPFESDRAYQYLRHAA